ncbi:hypothetical protein HanRHA438_Chr17g0799301 [Helianthus annuus]|nr:hypothetical protein HanHA89_Chr17g0694701 [Helianthus annuus]KAJ0825082.1 hypothetical protein HanRHA438_Chr17g0799301 [Helianthus annuus]
MPSYVGDRVVRELLAEVEREKQRERERRKKVGLGTTDIDAEDEEDYMGVGRLIEKLEKENQKQVDPRILNMREEPTDSESEEDDHRFTHEVSQQRQEILQKKLRRHEELLDNFTKVLFVFSAGKPLLLQATSAGICRRRGGQNVFSLQGEEGLFVFFLYIKPLHNQRSSKKKKKPPPSSSLLIPPVHPPSPAT